jgi:hypothetical protein
VAPIEETFDRASHEFAAERHADPTAANGELAFATALRERRPLLCRVLAARPYQPRGKAQVLVDYIDPANGEPADEQRHRLFSPPTPERSATAAATATEVRRVSPRAGRAGRAASRS